MNINKTRHHALDNMRLSVTSILLVYKEIQIVISIIFQTFVIRLFLKNLIYQKNQCSVLIQYVYESICKTLKSIKY